jgi:FkbM family methyltransferase
MNNPQQINNTKRLPDNYGLLDYSKIEILLSTYSETEKSTRLNSCKREPQTVNWVESLPNDSIFFDIGANTGSYSLIAGSQNKIGKKITVYSFEPHFANFAHLVKNVRINKLEEFIVPVNIAVSDKSETSKLYHWDQYDSDEAGSSGHQLNRNIDYAGNEFKPKTMQSILSVSLDDFCRMYDVYPTAIKIDVDGIEGLIIKGMSNLIVQESNLKSILIELNGESLTFINSFLVAAGFKPNHHEKNGNVLYLRD